jgi:hypothetical protein
VGESGEIIIYVAIAFGLFALAIIWRRYRETVKRRFQLPRHGARK